MEVYKLEDSEEEVTVLVYVGYPKEAGTQQGAAASGVRASKSFEFKGVVSTLDEAIWSRCSIASAPNGSGQISSAH